MSTPEQHKLWVENNRYSSNITKIYKESLKCDLVCSNCHRLRTWKRSVGQS